MTRECDVCGERRPCVELLLGESLMAVHACHECRTEATCRECEDAYQQDLNDRDYDAHGNPRVGEKF